MPKSRATLKDHSQEVRLYNRRALVAVFIIIALTLLLVSRLTWLQIYQHNLYTTLSQENQQNLLPLEPKRGLIYDRNGILLAQNIPVFSLEIIPDYVNNLSDTIARLHQIIQFSRDDVQAFFKALKQGNRYEGTPLKIRLDPDEVARFSLDQFRFPGVFIKPRLIRQYPFGAELAPVIGYVGRINPQELAEVDSTNYSASDYIGKTGIEKYYESQLHGTTGYEEVENDANGRIVRVLKKIPPVSGDNLYLTINSKLQTVAVQALGENPGSVIAIDPNSGQILAMVSNPSFDPNLFVDGITRQAYQELKDLPGRPLYNRAIRGQYPLASTIKLYMALEGLEAGMITPDTLIHDYGTYKLEHDSHIYHDSRVGGHGLVNLLRAITVSCDVYFYNLAHQLGIARMDHILNLFGFGKPTGIDVPDELGGVIASPDWKKQRFKQSWYPGDTINASIGQGFMLATPLQLANGVSALSMQGIRFKPYLLYALHDSNGKIFRQPPMPLTPVELHNNDNWELVRSAMRNVILSPEGTGRIHFGKAPYPVAAKTGTGQVFDMKGRHNINQMTLPWKLRDNSLFIAFAPVDHPMIAIAVIAEHTNVAPTIAHKVLDYYLLEEKHWHE